MNNTNMSGGNMSNTSSTSGTSGTITPKVVSVLDKLFNILNLINTSEIALSSYDVAEITGYNQRTVLRYLSRLVQEGLIDFGVRMETVTYDYNRKEDNQVFEVKRPSSTYEYYKLR
mgnify:CR=1 FL=1